MRPSLLALPLIACFYLPAAMPAAAQEAFIWVYDAHYPIDPADVQLNLVASQSGLEPDTDAGRLPGGLIWARCAPGGATGDVVLRFEAFPVAALAFDAYDFEISDGTGTVLSHFAQLVNREINEPTGGLEIVVPLDGPEMDMLATAPVVTYGITDFTDFMYSFDLSGNQHLVTRFREDCGDLVDAMAADEDTADATPPRAAPDVGPAISGHVWGRYTELSPDPTDSILQVFYAVPETDDVLIVGDCVVGAGGPLVALRAAADVEGMADGTPVDLRFTNGAGRSAVVPGNVVLPRSEEGIFGVEVVLGTSDRAWLVITGDDILTIAREGSRGGFTLAGNSPDTIGSFLSDCANVADLGSGAGRAPLAPIGAQPGFLSCEAEGRVSSRDTGAPQVLNFINETEHYRGLLWVDPNGNFVDVAGLNPGEARAFSTDPGHVWVATTGPGDCVEMIEPTAGQREYRLTVPN